MGSECFDKCPSVAILSHHHPLPTRKRQHENRCCRVPVYLRVSPHIGCHSRVLFFFLIVFLSCGALAAPILETETHGHRPALRAADDDLAWSEAALYLDPSPPPLLMPPLHLDDDATKTDPSLLSERSLKTLQTDPVTASTDFTVPRAFDTGLSSNFSSSCATFLNTLRQNEDFNSCDPFSLLIQTSSGFFDASKSTLRITQTLDATCGVDSTQCKTIMDSFALQLLQDNTCKSDYKSDNPVVLQAYNGLVAYQPAYKASCLHDSEGNYCFADAVSNTSSPGDAYPYYLPIGQELPGGSRPTCNSCLQQVMGVFAFYSNNATQPISKTYTSAAQQISIACGAKFVNVTAAPLKGAASTTSATFAPTITLILMFLLFFFQ